MTVAAVIPHWNRRQLLETLLRSLGHQTRSFDEVIVVDNGSTDHSVELAESAGARVLRLGRNMGFAAAVNRGIEAAHTDWVAVLNNDVTLAPEWLETLVGSAAREDTWFATGKILRTDDPSILDGAFDEISRGACAWRCGAGKRDSPLWNQPRPIRFASMTASLFRRALFDQVGFLDEMFESYLEDVDLGLRCALAGCAGIYVPAAVAYHRGSATLGPWNSDTVRLISQNQIYLAAKYFRGQSRLPVLVGQLLWGLLAFRHGRGLSYIQGKLSGWRLRDGQEPVSANGQRLRSIIEDSEKEIFDLQQRTGFDSYWRAYFWLLRR